MLLYAYTDTHSLTHGHLRLQFWMLTLEAMQGRSQSALKLSRHLTWLLTTFIALKYLPVGYYAFCPLLHCLQRLLTFGTGVLESASSELNFVSKGWRRSLKLMESGCWAVVAAQQFWVYSTLHCELAALNLMGSMSAAYHAVVMLIE